MKFYLASVLILILFTSCNGQPKRTKSTICYFKPPMDSVSCLILAPTDIVVAKLCTKYDAYWNDTIIDRGVKLSKREYHTSDCTEFFSGNQINWTFNKYKATDYYVKLEYWFEYFEKPKK